MRDDVFDNRCYDDVFRRVYEFEQYRGNKTHFWLELDYYITRDCFVSRIGESLDCEIRSYSGDKIFRDAIDKTTISARPYKVIGETVDPQGDWQDIYKVTELYGYAPDIVFDQFSAGVVEYPGTSDRSQVVSATSSCVFDNERGLIRFALLKTNSVQFEIGNILNITRNAGYYTGGEFFYGCISRPTSVVSKESVVSGEYEYWYYYCGDVSWYCPTVRSTFSSAEVLLYLRTSVITRGEDTREAFNMQTSLHEYISYHTSIPTVGDRLRIMAGNNEVKQISDATVPSITTWKDWINADGEICLLEPEIEIVHTLYKKTVKKCRCM